MVITVVLVCSMIAWRTLNSYSIPTVYIEGSKQTDSICFFIQ